jgi:Icc-related predicted phosphoesterase
MIIVGIADLHGDVSLLSRVFEKAGRVDVMLLLGDITDFGHAEHAKSVIDAVRLGARHVFAVAGNCDNRDVEDYLEKDGVGVHRKGVILDGIGFVGAGKSLPGPGRTPNEASENDFRRFLQDGIACLPNAMPLIFVTHQPPIDTAIDDFPGRGHVGSVAIRDYIEKEKPLISFSGHIHEAAGIDSIGDTKVVNPGPLRKGKYAYAEIEAGRVKTLELRAV